MFGSAVLDVAVGIVFIYILVCLLCSAIREGIEAWLKTRAAYLEHGIRELLHDRDAAGIVKDLYNHPLIFGLFKNEYKATASGKRLSILAAGGNLPSYIPAHTFALALMDLAARGPKTGAVSSDPQGPALSLDAVRRNVTNLNNQAVQRVLLSALDAAQGDINKFQTSIENWYNGGMDRVSGWYKRSTQWIILAIGLLVAVGMNINTITIADNLLRNGAERAAIVAMAGKSNSDSAIAGENYAEVKKDLESMNLPIGWSEGWGAPKHGTAAENAGWWNNLFAPIIGWLLTAVAASMGAPFWFDILNKVMVIRSTVKPPESQIAAPPPSFVAPTVPVQGDRGSTTPAFWPPQTGIASSPKDAESSIDGCDATITNATPDEDLPAAQGGIA